MIKMGTGLIGLRSILSIEISLTLIHLGQTLAALPLLDAPKQAQYEPKQEAPLALEQARLVEQVASEA